VTAVARYLDIRLRLNLDKPADRWIAWHVERLAEEMGVPVSRVVWSALRDCVALRSGGAGTARDAAGRPPKAGGERIGPAGERDGGAQGAAESGDRQRPPKPAPAAPEDPGGGPPRLSGTGGGEEDILDRLVGLGVPPEP
jgi:hypothetical protein